MNISKKNVIKIIEDGGYVKWQSVAGKASVYDKTHNHIGTMLYKTYSTMDWDRYDIRYKDGVYKKIEKIKLECDLDDNIFLILARVLKALKNNNIQNNIENDLKDKKKIKDNKDAIDLFKKYIDFVE